MKAHGDREKVAARGRLEEMEEPGVVVAAGPDGVGDGTLSVAADEACRRRMGVELLHVIHSPLVAVPADVDQLASTDGALGNVGRHVLAD